MRRGCRFGRPLAALAALGCAALLLQTAALAAAPVAITLTPATASTTPGATSTLTLQAAVPSGESLGAWTIDVLYDASTLAAVSCTATSGSVCNASYAAGDVRLSGAAASGSTGTVDLATIVLQAAASDTASSTAGISLTVDTLTDAQGHTLPSTPPAGTQGGAGIGSGSTGSGSTGGGGVSSGGGGSGGSAAGTGSTSTPTGSAASVGAAGGILATSDGRFSMNVPAGAVTGTGALAAAEDCTPPAGVPAGLAVASCVFTLQGTALAAPQVAAIQYTAASLGGLSPDRLSVYRSVYDAAIGNTWRFVPTAVDASAATVSSYVYGPETVVALAATRRFPDVPATFWAKAGIDTLLGADVVGGFPDGTFQPGAALTRAQFVKMLVVAAGLAPVPGATSFTDVPSDAWFAPYVSAAVQAGLAQGTSATTFAPDATVTREQLALFLSRALKLTGATKLAFTDAADVSPWAVAGVEAAVSAGYLNGFPGGSLQPLAPTTRAQAAKVLALAIGHMAP